VTRPPARLREYLAHQPGRCPECAWHEPTQGHAPDCERGIRLGREAMAATSDAHPSDVALVDRVLGEYIAAGVPFSLNEMRPHLGQVGDRHVIGARVNAAAKAGRIRHVGYVRSTEPRTKGHEIKVWQAIA
jgi:hypothetical protein